MKHTDVGIIRRFDALGRIVIPKEYRNALGVSEGDPMAISLPGDGTVVLRPALALVCANCNQLISAAAAYCPHCGAKRVAK